MWAPENWYHRAKMQFQAKICKFYVKITANFVNFSKCAQKFAIYI